jgi:hypothetical protein
MAPAAEQRNYGIELAIIAEQHLRKMKAWEIVTPAQLGIVTFRFAPTG